MHTLATKLKAKFAASAFARLSRPAPGQRLAVAGLHGSALSIACALLAEGGPIAVVARDDETAAMLADDLALFLETPPLRFDGPRHADADIETARRELLDSAIALRSAHAATLVLPPSALGLHLPLPIAIDNATFAIRAGELYELDDLVKSLSLHGYQRKNFVEEEGDIAVRGGLIDVFPFAAQQPVRVELRDIEVESIRTFDVLTQRSIRAVTEVIIPFDLQRMSAAGDTIVSVLEYLPAGSLVVIDEPDLVLGALTDESWRATVDADIARHAVIEHRQLGTQDAATLRFDTRSQPRFGGAVKALAQELIDRAAEGWSVTLCAETNEHAKRLRDLLEESDDTGTLPALDIHSLPIAEGFMVPGERWAVFTEHELFDRRRTTRKPARDKFRGITLRELRRLEKGDFVVHVDKGIGRFTGLETIVVNGTKQECVKLLYRDNDVLFVHLNHIDRLQKYVSKEGHVPHLSRLGGTEWVKAKEKMKARAEEIARKLLQIHARRKVEKGFAFSPDTHWQREMEASFLYDDTADQRRATDEVKHDMELTAPMDRLVCGDVGYGKTEVAVRAAFKSVQDGKQVAVLVPTTILAQQHYYTFKDRLDKYGVSVNVLSRFRTKHEQNEIVKRVAAGSVDVLVGTHRILSKDVVFKDLGLLIIDEEHRFGVAAKEKLREKKSTVDTLTLTATPIPRTMNLALVGLRDISVIETPPPNRLPVQTEIVQWDPEVIRRAVLHELHRGGQCFIVHDHVQSIQQLVDNVAKAVPEARIGVAHGQLTTAALEHVMMEFMLKNLDVLVCTKIVESGLDIPSVNTIFIHHAQNFGLAELYQLRGRVGRSNIQAHAYIIVPPLATLTTTALKRLYALEEFTDLGSGFQLALRDLELRGAGTILGGEQSGFIDALGFELYTQLLEQAVRELKAKEYGEIFKEELGTPTQLVRRDVSVRIRADALIPSFYVPDDTERFDLYKRLYQADTEVALAKVREELVDRFGEPPPMVEALFRAVRLKNAAGAVGFDTVIEREHELVLEISAEDAAADDFYLRNFDVVMKWVTGHPGRAKLSQKNQTLQLTVALDGSDAVGVAEEIRAVVGGANAQ